MKEVFKRPFYVVLTIVVFLSFLIFSIWLPNLPFIGHTMVTESLTAAQKVGLLKASLGAFKTNFSVFSRVMDFVIAFLFSVNVSLLIFYLKKRVSLEKSIGTSILGTILGIIGVGCASCGSVILTSLLGLTAASSFISILPLKGAEFGLLSVGLLITSNYLLLKQIKDPLVCGVTEKRGE